MNFTPNDNADLLELYNGLKNAYWYATTAEDKDLLTGAGEAVHALITEINRGAIKSRDDAYADPSLHLAATVARLQTVQDHVDTVVKHIEKAARLAKLIGKVIAIL